MTRKDKNEEKIQSVRGMKDHLPNETVILQYVEDVLKRVLSRYGYSEVRLPIIERTSLFRRAIGEVTDVVEKEMYSFKDRNGEDLTLRPEGTIGCLRAVIEHRLIRNQEQRLWYIGPMFRHERPQSGRYRQFHQLGVEAFGLQGPNIDAELIMLAFRWWRILGITKYISLEINSIGSLKERSRYCCDLVTFLEKHKDKLDEGCKRRIYSNPLRILDSKNPDIQLLLNDAPVLLDYLNSNQQEYFSELCKLLRDVGISYTVNRNLVRGLDYYNHTVFEWTSTKLGAKNTVCAGGRYDGLTEKLCGYASPAVGFAVGIERLILLIQTVKPSCKIGFDIDIYLATQGKNTQSSAMKLAEYIRDALPNIRIKIDYRGGTFKKQFALANKLGASIVLLLGNSEIEAGDVVIKDLRLGKQIRVVRNKVVSYLRNYLSKRI